MYSEERFSVRRGAMLVSCAGLSSFTRRRVSAVNWRASDFLVRLSTHEGLSAQQDANNKGPRDATGNIVAEFKGGSMKSLFAFLLTITACITPALAQSAAELFGQDAFISDVEMSPSGNVVAYTQRVDGEKVVVVKSLVTGEARAVSGEGDKLRGYEFYDDHHLVMFKSVTTRFLGYKGEYELEGAISINWMTGKAHQLLRKERDLLWPQLNLDRIFGVGKKPGTVLMGARTGANQEGATFDLYRVDLETGAAKRVKRGAHTTRDWFVDETETIYGREDYSNKYNSHNVRVLRGKKWESLFQNESDIPEVSFSGLSPDRKSLIVIDEVGRADMSSVYHMSLEDGSLSEVVFGRDDAEVDYVFKANGIVIGAAFSGLKPSYEFYDADLTEDVGRLLELAPESAVRIYEISDDFNKLLVKIEGNDNPGIYGLYIRDKNNLQMISAARPFLGDAGFGKIETKTIAARDGLEFTLLATYPVGVEPGSEEAKNLPTVMMPHGGPASYDSVGFDYMAQFLAHKGYLVIQPNFRGSTGFGRKFRIAGSGRWGKEMQDDVSDALSHFVELGVADPERICIVGASYGGYSALAGGAFTPELYKCVVAIAPVSDLPLMLNSERRDYGSDHWVVAYWESIIGDRREDREKLKEISPVNFASEFEAPVLIMHGDDDTVVPFLQSRRMERALKKADKPVEFVKLKGEDHWLSIPETRILALQSMGDFVDKYLQQ